ncbi:MAG: biotin transporter BioY [Propionibacteriaceae bacterium]|jgi:biotin transport system substrate-specific component|nr:biotin transporter BioY [Propionibacteriaceae bacterium]
MADRHPRTTAKDVALIALFAAFICVLGLTPRIALPFLPTPFTIQTLGVLLAGGVLGAHRGAWATALFLVLVAVGLPVLPGGVGGIGMLAGPTAGFLWTYPAGAWVTGMLVERWWRKLSWLRGFVAAVAGSVAVYPLGHAWIAVTTGMSATTASWSWVVYLPGDLIKSALAASVIVTMKRAYPLLDPPPAPTAPASRNEPRPAGGAKAAP